MSWNHIFGSYSDALPEFNDKLLLDFRETKINESIKPLDALFKQAIVTVDMDLPPEKDRLEYLGYCLMTPDEQIGVIKSKKQYEDRYDIQLSNYVTAKFLFRFQEVEHTMYVPIPYVDNHAVVLGGIEYYPLFAIIEKGGLHRMDDHVMIKVARARIKFWRTEKITFKTQSGILHTDINVTCRLHQRRVSKKSPPLLIYHLATWGFRESLKRYGFEGLIDVVQSEVDPDKYEYVRVRDDLFIQVDKDAMYQNTHVRRYVVSLLVIFHHNTKFEFDDIFDKALYYIGIGKWCFPSQKNDVLLYSNAEKHINANRSMLDPNAKRQLETVGIKVETLEDLLVEIFFNIDKWLANYTPENLFDKKLGSSEQMISSLVQSFNNKLFDSILNTKVGLTQETVNRLMNSGPKRLKWLRRSTMFRSKPTLYNPNWLLSIGSKRFRSLDNTEVTSDVSNPSKPMSPELLRAHPSSLAVESTLCFPSSSPIITGSINPFLEIDDMGNILQPEWVDEIADAFKM